MAAFRMFSLKRNDVTKQRTSYKISEGATEGVL